MKTLTSLSACVVALAILVACSAPKETTDEATASKIPTLKKKWETDTLLITCESVVYDKDNDVLYVANIWGAPDGKDGIGSIAKVGLDGKIIDAQWIKSLNAPKGMAISNRRLYVADIDVLVEIDIASGGTTARFEIEGAKFLNDVTVDGSGKVYVSDTGSGDVTVLENGVLTKFLSGQQGPNGLLSDGSTFLMALWDQKTLNTVDAGAVTLKADSIDNPDGIEAVGDGGYLVSSWNGMVTYVGPDGKSSLILDTRADSVSAADIEYIQEKKLLLVPTFFKNKVVAYELVNP